ncbi:MAG: glycoside hydrolase family 5 protein [Treponema sp.]|nr:glycoside hydrolase family 5 protein [Treponema sp.]
MKKIISLFTFLFIIGTFLSCNSQKASISFDKKKAVVDNGKKQIKDIPASELVNDMKTGWNLGNTLDATGNTGLESETSWGQPKTTKDMIDALAASGIKTIRIPVTWHNHIDKNYTIEPRWMARVKQIVDWAIEDGLYVIINSHHDNGFSPDNLSPGSGYYPSSKNFEESERFLLNVWSQIALTFNNGYDEHLIFEITNEPRLAGTEFEWWWPDENNETCIDAAKTMNKLNQEVLNVIRKSGGNNKIRLVSVAGLMASPERALSSLFEIPKDKTENHLAISIHMYSPYSFAMENPGLTEYTPDLRQQNSSVFAQLNSKFIKNGYPVIIGEYGATNKNNLEDRVKWFSDYIKDTRKYGICCCVWDNGIAEVHGNDFSEHYGYFNRKELNWYFPEILKAIRDNL